LGDVPLVDGHEGRLVQMILNPLVNGAQAMLHAVATGAARGRTTLTVITRTTANGDAEVEIVDEGPGFPAAVLARLGEPYVTTRSDQGGTGLGLFVTRGLVEAHGGTIQYLNRPEGGARVRVTLPAARTAGRAAAPLSDAAARPTAPSESNAHLPRVLLVEDDTSARRALLRGLEAEGFRAAGAADATEALEWLSREPVDLVVTDLMMPGVSGPEFARQLHVAHPRLREQLVVLTGGASSTEAEEFLRDPTLLVLEKPIRRTELAQQLRARLHLGGNAD
jgi:CheY-like chemotaxis protein